MLDSTTDSSRSPWPWYDQVDVTSAYPPGQLESGSVFVPRTPESFTHDPDGNLLSDGRWDYTWDGENRLIRMVAGTAAGPQQRLEFAYDWQGRRIAKVVWNNTAGTGTPAVDQRFLYDQWNLIVVAVEVESQFQLAQAFVWGTDLSGSMQGAGGVGGLLKMSQVGQSTTNCFAAFDGNGNVVGLVDASSGAVLARYEYGPFGELVRATGPMAKVNPFRFSTKYQDEETGLLYYGYRYYDPRTGRWPNRDPLGELGGLNLYVYVANDPVNRIDPYGLWQLGWPPWGKPKPKPPGQPAKKPEEKCKNCEKQDNPAKELFKTAADTLAGEVGGTSGGIVRLILLAGAAKQGCGDMKGAANTCGDFARKAAKDPGYEFGQYDCEACCHAILNSFPGLGGISYFECHALCAKF